MSTITKDLGMVTAYAYAVSQGYTGTEEEFAELMASYAEVAEEAAESARQAAASATSAGQSATNAAGSASTANTKAGEAATSAQTATTKAGEAATSANNAAGSATTASNAANTATEKASEASQSAANAAASATTANSAADDAIAAKTAAETAKTAAQTSAQTAQQVLEDIPEDYTDLSNNVSQLKSAFGQVDVNLLPLSGKFVIPSLTPNTYINKTNGKRATYNGWVSTDYIDLGGATSIYIPSALGTYHAFYTAKDETTFVSETGVGNITVPSTAKYMRLSCGNAYSDYLYKVTTPQTALEAAMLDSIHSVKQGLNSSTAWAELSNDADNLIVNGIYQITYSDNNIQHLPVLPFNGTIITFDFNKDAVNKGEVQIAFKNTGELYKRIKWGTAWRDWYRVAMYDDIPTNIPVNVAYKGLGNFVACGDSITKSLSYPTSSQSKQVKSWATSFAEMCGSNATIYAEGGRSTVDFLASADYPLAVADTSQYAFLFLGINDINESVGVETFTTNYTTIVNALLTNHKFVFCVNIPQAIQTSGQRTAYNEAIASVCESISKAFLVDITGCSDRIAVFKNYGHLSSIGYALLAGEIATAVNATMSANDYFDAQIDTDSY